MLDALKKIIRKTPIGNVWDSMQESKYKKYVASISSDQPVYPLYCISCKRYYKEFLPLGSYYDEMFEKHGFPYRISHAETLNSSQYKCPGCGMNDRDRLYAIYLEKTIEPQRHYTLVEFAPSQQLSSFIKQYKNVTHRTADLFMEGVDDKVDLLDMRIYQDNSFDIFICSHILEHVDDDVQAMRELYRILKPSGFGIAMVPILEGVNETKEDPSIKDENLRWKYFGQDDHVRLYKRQDFIDRLAKVGFRVNQYDRKYFGDDVFRQNGISDSSVLYIVQK